MATIQIGLYIFETDSDPTTATGLTAPIGSVAFLTVAPGGVWHKTGSSDTAWSRIAVVGISSGTFNAPVTQTPDQANASGSSGLFAQSDHVHNIAADVASSISTSTSNAEGVSTSFARADHTHAISLTNSSVVATSNATTTSATDVLITSMTSTPAAGTYLVIFSTSLDSNSNNANIFVSIYSGGSQVADTERKATPQFQGGVTPSLNAALPVSTQTIVTVNGSQAIEARWRITAGTATAHQRTLSLIKLS